MRTNTFLKFNYVRQHARAIPCFFFSQVKQNPCLPNHPARIFKAAIFYYFIISEQILIIFIQSSAVGEDIFRNYERKSSQDFDIILSYVIAHFVFVG